MLTPRLAVDFKPLESKTPIAFTLLPPASESVRCGPGKVSILLVDPNPSGLAAMEKALVDLGEHMVKARSGEEALRLLRREECAIILLAVSLAGPDGFATARMIRQREGGRHSPIIFISPVPASEEQLAQAYALGAVGYLLTPVIPEVLRGKVRVLVELIKKTGETKAQADQLRRREEQEHLQRLNEAARRLDLQTRQNRFFTLSVDLLAIADFHGEFRELNPAWARVLGVSEQELKAGPFWRRMEPADQEISRRAIGEAVRDQRPVHFEANLACADGSARCFSWTAAPYAADSSLYLFARDITERRRAEREITKLNADLAQRAEQLQAANAELEAEIVTRKRAEAALHESNSALETFSCSVSHDLRAPIRAMQGFASVLLDEYGNKLDEMGRECAARIIHAAGRMDALVHDLLVFSRLGHTTLELSPVSVREAILEALCQLDNDLKKRGAVVEAQGPFPAVLAHPTTLIQVLANLLSNAAKFVAPGTKPRVAISAAARGELVTISVQDNGIGIAPEDHARIFRVFERLHGTDDFPGTGLGLAIVRKGAERMGGQVGVESRPGQGSRFWLRLALAPSASAARP